MTTRPRPAATTRGRRAARVRVARAVVAAGWLAATVLAGGESAAAGVAAARPAGDCTATAGTIVAVDFAHWGGPVLRSCGSTPTTGYALLNQGGWSTAGDEHDGPGFICRIGYNGFHHGTQYPTPRTQACVLTPPASAYWTYWQAGPGQDSWTYSQAGAMGVRPVAGSVSLWVFGGTNLSGTKGSAVPDITPRALRAAATARADGRPAIVDAAPVAADPPAGHGSPVPAITGLVIAGLLAAAGAIAVRRRRPAAGG
jgi:hypothetical protein